jgi:hypothetical protein
VNPVFTVLEGFDPFQVPAAVSGGGVGPGGLGGGLGGLAGMNGPMVGPGQGLSSLDLARRGLNGGVAPDRGDVSPSDFEDQPWPSAYAQAPVERPRAAVRSSKSIKRRRGAATRSLRTAPSGTAKPQASTSKTAAK